MQSSNELLLIQAIAARLAIALATVIVVAVGVQLTPLGRSLTHFLRDRRRVGESNEAVLAQLEQLQIQLGEVVERLDATERRLAAGGPPRLPAELKDRDQPQYQLSDQVWNPVSGYRLRDGRILILDPATLQLRFFDSTGIWIRTVGGRGDGPGEFVSFARLIDLGIEDSIVVSSSQRISVFDSSGRFVRSTP